MSFFEDLISHYQNQTDNFIFEATNIDGVYKYLNTVTLTRITKLLIKYTIFTNVLVTTVLLEFLFYLA